MRWEVYRNYQLCHISIFLYLNNIFLNTFNNLTSSVTLFIKYISKIIEIHQSISLADNKYMYEYIHILSNK